MPLSHVLLVSKKQERQQLVLDGLGWPLISLGLPYQSGLLKQQKLFSQNSGGEESKVKVSAGLLSSESFLFGLQRAIFSLYLHLVFLVCMSEPDFL